MPRTPEERQRDEEAFRILEEERERERDERAEEERQSKETKKIEKVRQQPRRKKGVTGREANPQQGGVLKRTKKRGKTPQQTRKRRLAEVRNTSALPEGRVSIARGGQRTRAAGEGAAGERRKRYGNIQKITPRATPPDRPTAQQAQTPTQRSAALARARAQTRKTHELRRRRAMRRARKRKTRPTQKQGDGAPYIFSPEGIAMLTIALLLDIIPPVIVLLLDFFFGLGEPFSWALDIFGTMTLGLWMWARGGEMTLGKKFARYLKRRAPLIVAEYIPVVGAGPWWTINVILFLKK